MANNNFGNPTQFSIEKIMIEDYDVTGMFVNIAIFENIYIPIISGNITMLETDGGEFMEKKGIEFTEEFSMEFTNALDEKLVFEGKLNGVKQEVTKDNKRMYLIEFAANQNNINEQRFVTKRFKNVKPEDVVSEMIKRLEGEEDQIIGTGEPMNFLGSRRKPCDIIKYVLTHGVTTESSATDNGQEKTETSTGTTGFLCWQTLQGYRFASIDQIKNGEVGELHPDFTRHLANRGASMEEAMLQILDMKFPKIGNQHDKMRSGAYRSKSVLFDMDKGFYKEYEYVNEENMTEKQKEVNKSVSRFMCKATSNERHNLECNVEQIDTGDQTRRQLQQNNARQNTFDDQFGALTINPAFQIHAGDTIEIKVGKMESEREGGYDEKHSGTYVIKGVAHHLNNTGNAYTVLSTIRTNLQQDDATSTK